MDAHCENGPEFQIYPHHCVAGTVGQQKAAVTLIEKRDQQIFIEKQTLDCFSNPKLLPLLAELDADRYVVYGGVTEICVRLAIFGLLKTGKRLQLVTDAVKALDENAAIKMVSEFLAAGGRQTQSSGLI